MPPGKKKEEEEEGDFAGTVSIFGLDALPVVHQ